MVSAAQRLLGLSLAAFSLQLQPDDPEQLLTRSTAGAKHMRLIRLIVSRLAPPASLWLFNVNCTVTIS
jgi:hypothetical protein